MTFAAARPWGTREGMLTLLLIVLVVVLLLGLGVGAGPRSRRGRMVETYEDDPVIVERRTIHRRVDRDEP